MSCIYNFFWLLWSIILKIFYKRITIVGKENIPREDAVIFIVNHPNGLIDPAVIMTQNPRYLHFIAKSTLFNACSCLGWLLKQAGGIPVYRHQDQNMDEETKIAQSVV